MCSLMTGQVKLFIHEVRFHRCSGIDYVHFSEILKGSLAMQIVEYSKLYDELIWYLFKNSNTQNSGSSGTAVAAVVGSSSSSSSSR